MFDLQGHRGARALYAENTLPGFLAAMAMGVRSFELDVGVTRDGEVVVHHDPALNPDIARRDGEWLGHQGPLIHELTYAELIRYDVGRLKPGTAYADQFPRQAAQDGAAVPTLAQVLRLDDQIHWNIELKLEPAHPEWTVAAEEMAERVLHVLDQDGAGPRVTVQSFDWRAPRHLRRIRPAIARGWLTHSGTVADQRLWWGREPVADVVSAIINEGGGTWTPHYQGLTQDAVAQAQHRGLRVIPWTVNDVASLRRLIGWNVDGVITDWPDRAMGVLAEADARAAPLPG